MTAAVPDPLRCCGHGNSETCLPPCSRHPAAAVPDPRFRDQLALWLLERYPDSYEDDSRSERRDADALLPLVAAEVEARVQAAAAPLLAKLRAVEALADELMTERSLVPDIARGAAAERIRHALHDG